MQGVGFRYFVFNIAKRLKLNGYTRNLYSGDVEIEVEGERGMIEDMLNSLRIGPRSAHVANIKAEWNKCEYKFKKFEIF